MKLLLSLLGLAKYALLIGLVVLGLAAWTTLRAGTGGGLPALRELKPVGGLVIGAREVSVERQRRPSGGSGGSGTPTAQKFFELDLQTEAGGTPLKLRVDPAVGRERLEVLLNRRATVHYDPRDVNIVYAVHSGGQDVLTYAEMAKLLQDRADRARTADGSAGSWMAGIGLVALGGAGVAWRRRLVASPNP